MDASDAETGLRLRMAASLGIDAPDLRITGNGILDSAYPVSELATASIATAAAAVAGLVEALGGSRPDVTVDRSLADSWFGSALTPVGWSIPSPWDAIAGDYAALPVAGRPAWIRLHTNAPRHRAAALRVLGVEAERDHVAAAVARWSAQELEDEVVAEGGCAAMLRTPDEWAAHPQGSAVADEPLVAIERTGGPQPDAPRPAMASEWTPQPGRPLAGLRVLDLTRVLAGPVATRLLAGLGADVLRIDSPDWDEPGVVPDMTIGKRLARLDARDPVDLARLRTLLSEADVLVHGYRSDALERLGLPDEVRREVRPGLVDVSLDAYGYTGPWRTRRGFDSLVQMSTGIAGAGLRSGLADRPTPLPVQALDHSTGYLMAAAVIAGLAQRIRDGRGTRARLSLARTAAELVSALSLPARPMQARQNGILSSWTEPVTASVSLAAPIDTPWGAATVLPAPFAVDGVTVAWSRGPRPLGSDAPSW
jgi:crotonobetainyl-CoA:carnitine CoA-transferase CaiB-like acyl-CoA transferase